MINIYLLTTYPDITPLDDDKTNLHITSFSQRVEWGGGLEFLMACIAASVGLGNVWRFPFTAYENGGGAFLIPYIIVLFFVGKPFYFLEGFLGQFTSKSCAKTWAMVPAMKGNVLMNRLRIFIKLYIFTNIIGEMKYTYII